MVVQEQQTQIAHCCKEYQVVIEHEVPEPYRVPSRIGPQRYQKETDTELRKSLGSESVGHNDRKRESVAKIYIKVYSDPIRG